MDALVQAEQEIIKLRENLREEMDKPQKLSANRLHAALSELGTVKGEYVSLHLHNHPVDNGRFITYSYDTETSGHRESKTLAGIIYAIEDHITAAKEAKKNNV